METLQAARPLRIGDVTLVPIARAGIQSSSGDSGYWISAFKEAIAVVVCDANGVRALATGPSEITLDALMEEMPGLAAVLSELSAP
jgi:hypothetical protein